MKQQSTPIAVEYYKLHEGTPNAKRHRLMNDQAIPLAKKYKRTEAEMTAALALLMLRYNNQNEHAALVPCTADTTTTPESTFIDDTLNVSRISYDDTFEGRMQRYKRESNTSFEDYSSSSHTYEVETLTNTSTSSGTTTASATAYRSHHFTRNYRQNDQKRNSLTTSRMLKDRINNDDTLRQLLNTNAAVKEKIMPKVKEQQPQYQLRNEFRGIITTNDTEPSAIESCRNILNEFLTQLRQNKIKTYLK